MTYSCVYCPAEATAYCEGCDQPVCSVHCTRYDTDPSSAFMPQGDYVDVCMMCEATGRR